jgi:predicted alpha/beta superfamily hydrolase
VRNTETLIDAFIKSRSAMKDNHTAANRLTIELLTPETEEKPVYLCGNFNNWTAGDDRYRMTRISSGKYEFTFPEHVPLPEIVEYKFLRGSWENEELDTYGNTRNNRKIHSHAGRISAQVPRWRSEGLAYKPELLPKIHIIDEAFEIPQLIKTRRIAALLPHNYFETDRRYPVLYLQDGQNLFDDFAPFGNWAVDKKLALMSEKGQGDIIVISIDHAEHERIAEFTPSIRTRLGQGEGKKYVRFLADTLKPFVDKNFRTLTDRDHTGIGGSSMGGLISIYAGLMYPEVYSRLMIFSPSLWVAPNIHAQAQNLSEAYESKIYLYGGQSEGAGVVPAIYKFKQALQKYGFSDHVEFQVSIDPKGHHNEARWGEEFPKAVEWLFFR